MYNTITSGVRIVVIPQPSSWGSIPYSAYDNLRIYFFIAKAKLRYVGLVNIFIMLLGVS
jgi:hypothetical protein